MEKEKFLALLHSDDERNIELALQIAKNIPEWQQEQ